MSVGADGAALAEDLLAQLAELDILDDEWLRVSFGPTVPAGTWTTPAALLAPDADGVPGAGLGFLVDRIVATTPGVASSLVWSTAHLQALWGLTDLDAKLLARARRVIRFAAADVRLLLDLVSAEPAIRGLHLTAVRLAVLADDPLVGRRGVEVVSEPELTRRFVDDLAAIATPFVDAVRARVAIGRRALWGQVLDALVTPIAERRPGDAGPDDAKRRVAQLLDALDGTPLRQRVDWVDFLHRGEPHCALRSTACCLAYQWPAAPGQARRIEGGDPRWDRYCQSCPLIPVEETALRARFWIEHPGPHPSAPPPPSPPEVPS